MTAEEYEAWAVKFKLVEDSWSTPDAIRAARNCARWAREGIQEEYFPYNRGVVDAAIKRFNA